MPIHSSLKNRTAQTLKKTSPLEGDTLIEMQGEMVHREEGEGGEVGLGVYRRG